ncbi:MAG: hypothetical protein HZC01_02225 [Candidatus Kerfeldbacteria bacterium]|nr:hypothetical protein [Candidatus Kerfeldbacteria bacterium]
MGEFGSISEREIHRIQAQASEKVREQHEARDRWEEERKHNQAFHEGRDYHGMSKEDLGRSARARK